MQKLFRRVFLNRDLLRIIVRKKFKNDDEYFCRACREGRLDLLCMEPFYTFKNKCMVEACRGGHKDVVSWLYHDKSMKLTKECLLAATMEGRTTVVQWIAKTNPSLCAYQDVFRMAVFKGYCSIARVFLKNEFHRYTVFMNNDLSYITQYYICSLEDSKNYFRFFQWLCTETTVPIVPMDIGSYKNLILLTQAYTYTTSSDLSTAIFFDSLPMLQWSYIHSKSMFTNKVKNAIYQTCSLSTVEWLYKETQYIPPVEVYCSLLPKNPVKLWLDTVFKEQSLTQKGHSFFFSMKSMIIDPLVDFIAVHYHGQEFLSNELHHPYRSRML